MVEVEADEVVRGVRSARASVVHGADTVHGGRKLRSMVIEQWIKETTENLDLNRKGEL